jgi:hypothetical protein
VPGTYTLVGTANDGQLSQRATVTVTVDESEKLKAQSPK